MQKLAETLLNETDWAGIMITDKDEIVGSSQRKNNSQMFMDTGIPGTGREAMVKGEIVTMHRVSAASPLYELMKEYSLIAAPYIIKNQSVGCLIVWVKKRWVFQQSEVELLQHLVTLSSYPV